MSANPNVSESSESLRSRIHPLIAAAAVAVIVVSGVGVAALTGILPSSKAVPAAVSAPALIDTQPSVSLNGLKPNVQPQAPSTAPAQPRNRTAIITLPRRRKTTHRTNSIARLRDRLSLPLPL